jgi:hypothetical protein
MADTASKVNTTPSNFPSAEDCKKRYSINLMWINKEIWQGDKFIMHYSGNPGRLQKRKIEVLLGEKRRSILLEMDSIPKCLKHLLPEEQAKTAERQQFLQKELESLTGEKEKKVGELLLISPERQEKEFVKTELLMPALEWAKTNPNADINIWFDSDYVPENSAKNTHTLLMDLITEHPQHRDGKTGAEKIHFHDVREIEVVKYNPELFSFPIDLYFRIDLLKSVITLHEIEDKGNCSAIFADIDTCDLRKLSDSELFSAESMEVLEKNGGFLLAGKGIENFFLQLINNPGMLEATRQAIINVNLARVHYALNMENRERNIAITNLICRTVFATQRCVFNYYQTFTTERGVLVRVDADLEPCEEGEWINYNPTIHGYKMFGLLMASDGIKGVSPCRGSDYVYAHEATCGLNVQQQAVVLRGRTDVKQLTTKLGGDHVYTYPVSSIPCKVKAVTFMPWSTKWRIQCQSPDEKESAHVTCEYKTRGTTP